jgi:deoxyribodipyrimidine photo-lyase
VPADPAPVPKRMTGMDNNPVIVWFRQDLRLADNPALAAAVDSGRPVLPLFVLDDETPGAWRPGGASRWWLHHSLAALADDLAARGAPLLLRQGRADAVLPELVSGTGAGAVLWNRCYEPFAVARDHHIKAVLKDAGVDTRSFNAALLCEPWQAETGAGGPYKVFTPYWKSVSAGLAPPPPGPAPGPIAGLVDAPGGDALDDWGLLPAKPDWAGGLRETWRPGEAGARARLAAFLDDDLAAYAEDRDRPDLSVTSRLSPHLHWGEIGPRQIWHAVQHRADSAKGAQIRTTIVRFLAEIGWREFAHHLLFHYPDLPEANWKSDFDGFAWRDDPAGLRAWQRGRTGYPLVDAGMRELWATGWMHNRVRMVAASFLVKHLLIDWRAGEAWFWDTLVDADLANNAAGWQWVAGCGADAAPYFRIFNPIAQGEKFDPDTAYIRRWVPELAGLPDTWVHRPWDAPDDVCDAAGFVKGESYPAPIVDHGTARERALAAYRDSRGDRAA